MENEADKVGQGEDARPRQEIDAEFTRCALAAGERQFQILIADAEIRTLYARMQQLRQEMNPTK